jgi:hypothetical protein
LRIGCIPLSTLPPSSSVLSSPPNQDLYYIYASVRGEKSAHLLGTENQAARLSLGQRWGEIAVRISFTVSSRIASPLAAALNAPEHFAFANKDQMIAVTR